MTTRIAVTNFGPKPVKVEVQERTKGGQLTQGTEHKLDPLQVAEINVHKGNQLLIVELED